MDKEKLYAKFYNLEYQNKKDDVNFYCSLAQKTEGPILECACGTGRILIPISKMEKEIWGFDINAAMLGIAKEKIKALKISNKKIKIFQDDLTKFSSPFLKNKKFKFIFLSFDGLAYLAQKDETFYPSKQTRQRQYLALKNITKHLDKNGLFAMDLFSSDDLSKKHILRHHFSRKFNGEIWNLFSSIQTPTEHIFQIHYFIEVLKNNGSIKKWYYPLSGYQASFEEILSLLNKVGLHPEKIYGNFELNPYKSGSKQMIFVCRKV